MKRILNDSGIRLMLQFLVKYPFEFIIVVSIIFGTIFTISIPIFNNTWLLILQIIVITFVFFVIMSVIITILVYYSKIIEKWSDGEYENKFDKKQ